MFSCETLNHALASDCNMVFNHACNIFPMNTLGERVAIAINESGISVKDVAAACRATVQAIYAWKRGEVKDLRNDNLFALADITKFEARWIATGQGPDRPPSDRKEKALLDLYRASDERGRSAIIGVAESQSSYNVIHDEQSKRSA